jgi:hypothetical protein
MSIWRVGHIVGTGPCAVFHNGDDRSRVDRWRNGHLRTPGRHFLRCDSPPTILSRDRDGDVHRRESRPLQGANSFRRCTLLDFRKAALLPEGDNIVTAAYGGDANFLRSTVTAGTVMVTRASVRVRLTVAPTSVTFGHEQLARFTVTLAPQYLGVPTGTVHVMAGKTRLCTLAISPNA